MLALCVLMKLKHTLEWREGALIANGKTLIPQEDNAWRTKLRTLHPQGSWSNRWNWGKDPNSQINLLCICS